MSTRSGVGSARKAAPQVGDVVRVEWYDHWFDTDFRILKDMDDDCLIVNYGEVVRVTPRVLSVAWSNDQSQEYRVQHIYTALIKSVAILTPEEEG